MNSPSPQQTPQRLGLAIVLVSVAMLMFEIWQTITLSIQTLERNAFLVVSLCLLGLGGGGSIATWLGSRGGISVDRVLWRSAFGFAVTAVVASMVSSRTILLPALIVLGVLPYLFVGVFLSFVFRSWPAAANRNYFLNLVGSGLGCLGLVWIINGTGDAAATLLVIASIAAVGAAVIGPDRRAVRLSLLAIVFFAALVPFSGRLFKYPVAAEKGMAMIQSNPRIRSAVEWTRWGYLGRLDVLRPGKGIEHFKLDGPATKEIMDKGAKVRYLFASGGNWTQAVDFQDNEAFKRSYARESKHALPYKVTSEPDVLNIGFGGGIDIFLSLAHGAKSVVGVDINPLMIEAGREHLKGYYDDFYNDPRVTIERMDGRAYVRNTDRRFDVVSLTAVDTGELLHSNAHVLLENYLYTQEAFEDYFSVLNDDGFLYVSRPHTQTMRAVTTAVAALRATGAPNPENHFVILGRGFRGRGRWLNVLVGKQPITPQQKQQIRTRYRDAIAYVRGAPSNEPTYDSFFTAVASDNEDKDLARRPLNYFPVHDDRPFFYEFGWSLRESTAGGVLFNVMLWVAAIGLVLVLLPMFGSGLGAEHRGALLGVVGYFGAIGAGFMFVEIALIQKLILYLGHPSYSVTVTLFSILIFSGLGAMFARRLPERSARTAAIIWLPIVAAAIFYAVGLGALLPKFGVGSYAVRGIVVALLLAPGSFFMGMPFPTMVRLLGERHAPVIPWAWAINAFVSVLASVTTVLLAMRLGFTTVLYVGAGFYVVALLFFLLTVRQTGASSQ